MSQSTWNVVTAVAIVGTLLVGFLRKKCGKALSAQLRFGYRAEDLNAPQGDWFLLPLFVFAALCMAVVTHNTAEMRWLRHGMYALTLLSCLCAQLENLCLFCRNCFGVAAVLGKIKWTFFGVWTLGMFIGLFVRAWAI